MHIDIVISIYVYTIVMDEYGSKKYLKFGHGRIINIFLIRDYLVRRVCIK